MGRARRIYRAVADWKVEGLSQKKHTQSLRAEGIKVESQQRKRDLSPGTVRN